jgi:hypothetical protein
VDQSRLTRKSHGPKGRLNLIQREEPVKSWLKKLIHQLTEKQGLVLLRLSFNRQNKLEPQISRSNAIPVCPLCGVAPLNWTVHNKWCRFVTETKSTETVLVGTDDEAVRVPLDRVTHAQQGCVDQMRSAFGKETCGEKLPKKENLLTHSHVRRELPSEKERKGRHVPTRPGINTDEREMEHTSKGTDPSRRVPEIRCAQCDATRTQLAARGDPGPCCNPFLTCSYELLWRSLPCGEDR